MTDLLRPTVVRDTYYQLKLRNYKVKRKPSVLRVFKLYLKASTFPTKNLGWVRVEKAGDGGKCCNDIHKEKILSLLLACICKRKVQKEEYWGF